MRAAYKPGPRYRWPFWLMLAAVGLLGYFTYGYFIREADTPYRQGLEEYRAQRQRFLDADSLSPWKDSQQPPRLVFYEPDMAWRIEAELTRFERDSFQIQKIKSMEKIYKMEGYATFAWKEKTLRLLMLRSTESPDSGHLFIPFRDRTNGNGSYANGRYLDLPADAAGRLTLDFNLAYQPFCAYDTTLVCPLPPEENTLPMDVRAGERL